jgi:hypothetical protein
LSRGLHGANSNTRRHSTETVTSTISDGTPDRSMIVTGLPLTGIRRMRESTCAMVSLTMKLENMKSKR